MTSSKRTFAASASPIRVLVVDDHAVLREVIAHALDDEPGFRIVAQAADAASALEAWRQHGPDVTLLDVSVFGIDGIETLQRIRTHAPAARVVVLASSHQRTDAQAAIDAGAAAYITKNSGYDELLEAIRSAHAGSRPVIKAEVDTTLAGDDQKLSDRELEVLHLLRDGLSHEAIAVRLSIADRTVRAHIFALKMKLAAANAAQCVARGYEIGLLRISGGAAAPGLWRRST